MYQKKLKTLSFTFFLLKNTSSLYTMIPQDNPLPFYPDSSSPSSVLDSPSSSNTDKSFWNNTTPKKLVAPFLGILVGGGIGYCLRSEHSSMKKLRQKLPGYKWFQIKQKKYGHTRWWSIVEKTPTIVVSVIGAVVTYYLFNALIRGSTRNNSSDLSNSLGGSSSSNTPSVPSPQGNFLLNPPSSSIPFLPPQRNSSSSPFSFSILTPSPQRNFLNPSYSPPIVPLPSLQGQTPSSFVLNDSSDSEEESFFNSSPYIEPGDSPSSSSTQNLFPSSRLSPAERLAPVSPTSASSIPSTPLLPLSSPTPPSSLTYLNLDSDYIADSVKPSSSEDPLYASSDDDPSIAISNISDTESNSSNSSLRYSSDSDADSEGQILGSEFEVRDDESSASTHNSQLI